MSNNDESIGLFTVSGRFVHAWDFTFFKNNGEIANRIRTQLGSTQNSIKIDNEGDIELETKESTFFITSSSVIGAGFLTRPKTLHEDQVVFVQRMELFTKCKGSFAPESFNVRLFKSFTPDKGLSLLGGLGFDSVLQSILGNKAPSSIEALKFTANYSKEPFEDVLELDASTKNVQLRYHRNAKGPTFPSYEAFLEACNLDQLILDIEPFAQVLKAAEPEPRRRKGPF